MAVGKPSRPGEPLLRPGEKEENVQGPGVEGQDPEEGEGSLPRCRGAVPDGKGVEAPGMLRPAEVEGQ